MKTKKCPTVPGIIQLLRAWPVGVRLSLVMAMTLAAISLLLALPAIPQPLSYHQFADQRTWLAIPHFLNVLTNIPLALCGAVGLWCIGRRRGLLDFADILSPAEIKAYRLFFLGALLTGLGSAYYHWAPDNARLVWDRLPMTLCFMAFLVIALSGHIGERAVQLSLPILVTLGLASVIHWFLSEQRGEGDLRLYGFVQFFPMLLIPSVLILFPSPGAANREVLMVLALYGLAIVCDQALDARLFALGEIISGHSLKHLIAAFAVYWLLRGLSRRLSSTVK